ncbi:MAG: RNA polymerase sigma factor RpoD, partial [Acetobacter sp.]|nr:RNA polymerase sigma factor RpoD [Acetobacter sp.]
MAKKIASTAQEQESNDLLDARSSVIMDLIDVGRERGCITFDELNAALPQEKVSPELIDEVINYLSDMGIQVVEIGDTNVADIQYDYKINSKEGILEEEAEEEDIDEDNLSESANIGSSARNDDPVRIYLREMGEMELLSREGEIAIAKRIEFARDEVISGLCESPLTLKAIISWYEKVRSNGMQLRHVVDLEAMQGNGNQGSGNSLEENSFEESEESESSEDDSRSENNNTSISLLEKKFMPEILVCFGEIEALYDKLRQLQIQRIDVLSSGLGIDVSLQKSYDELRGNLIRKVKQVHLHANRIEELVVNLRKMFQSLTSLEGKMLRLAQECRISRDDF